MVRQGLLLRRAGLGDLRLSYGPERTPARPTPRSLLGVREGVLGGARCFRQFTAQDPRAHVPSFRSKPDALRLGRAACLLPRPPATKLAGLPLLADLSPYCNRASTGQYAADKRVPQNRREPLK